MEVNHALPKRLVSVPEAADLLSIGKSAAWELVKSGDLASVKIGQRRLVPVAAIDSYIEALLRKGSEHERSATTQQA